MSAALAVNIAAWIWVLAGLAMVITGLVVVSFKELDDMTPSLALLGINVTGIGSLVLALQIVGLPNMALWAWRVAGVLCVLVSLFSVRRPRPPDDLISVRLAGLVVLLIIAGASFWTESIAPAPVKSAAPGPTKVIFNIDGVALWHGVALGVLGLGTVVFLLLFVRMVERGMSLQVESNWGGIGGGMAGWRVSPSLTYFAAAAIFGVLFAIFVFQLKSDTAGKNPPPPATPTAKPPK